MPGNLTYEIQYGIVPLDTDDGIVKQGEKLLGSITEDIESPDVIAYMLRWNTPLSGLALGFTGFNMGNFESEANIGDVNTTRFDEYVASLEYISGKFAFSAEYRYETITMDLNGKIKLIENRILEAWHTTGAYRCNDWFELGLGYSEIYVDRDDKDGERFVKIGQPAAKAWRRDWTLITRFDINDNWIFKLEGHYMNGLEGITGVPNKDSSENWFLFAAKVTFSF